MLPPSIKSPELPNVSYAELSLLVPEIGKATVPELLIIADGPDYSHRRAFIRTWRRRATRGYLPSNEASELVKDFGLTPSKEIGELVLVNTVENFNQQNDDHWIQYGGSMTWGGAFKGFAIRAIKKSMSHGDHAGYDLVHASPPVM